MEINVDIIKELISSLGTSTFDTLRLETDEFKLMIERGTHQKASGEFTPTVEVNSVSVATPPIKKQQEPKRCEGTVVKSPIVGTFYTSASPEKPALVKVGQRVKSGDTLYVIESMKLMNEVTSECDGTVAEIFMQNGQMVEYGQPIMRIE
jgi:acetyl-CoA carboxylase biotin carboxyl carrier protein